MAINPLGQQFICANLGDASFCCVKSGLSWDYTEASTGDVYSESGGTAQAVSRLASGIISSLKMTNPSRPSITPDDLNNANGGTVTLQDAGSITSHDEPTEDQWCFIPCETHTDQNTCENIYQCYWYNGACHTNPPGCGELNNTNDCERYGCYWYNGACHPSWGCEDITNEADCNAYGCYWYNGMCHSNPPLAGDIANELDCLEYNFYWYRDECHAVDQAQLCYFLDTQWVGGSNPVDILTVFDVLDTYIMQQPLAGWSFVATITEVFGVIDYYLGMDGNANTGCLMPLEY